MNRFHLPPCRVLAWCMYLLPCLLVASPSGSVYFTSDDDIGGPTTNCVNNTANYIVTAPQPGFLYAWTLPSGGLLSASMGITTSVSWTEVGVHLLYLQVTDPGGHIETCSLSVEVFPRPAPVILSPQILDCAIKGGVPADRVACWVVCEFTEISYFTTEVLGHTYEWSITGGTLSSTSGANVTVAWGAAPGSGMLLLTETNPGGCSRTVQRCFNIIESPTAGFSINGQGPDPEVVTICSDQVVYFTDQSVGAAYWLWDFGDGNTSTLPNPSHTYGAPGIYTGVLEVRNECGCSSHRHFKITVTPEPSPVIGCISTVCLDDCAFYSVSNICTEGAVTWTVNGGQVLDSPTPGAIQVVWNDNDNFISENGYGELCAEVSNCPDLCDGIICVRVPVIHPVRISGETEVCFNDVVTYTVPIQPGITEPGNPNGVVFDWEVIGGSIVSAPPHPNSITVLWDTPCTTCVVLLNGYENSVLGCAFDPEPLSVDVRQKLVLYTSYSEICVGENLSVSNQSNISIDYYITGPDGVTIGPITSSNGLSVPANAPGLYIISGQHNDANYCSTVNNVVITVFPSVETPQGDLLGADVVCPTGGTDTYTYSIPPPAGFTYVWAVQGGTLVNTTGQTVSVVWTPGATNRALSVRLQRIQTPLCASDWQVFTITNYTLPTSFVTGPTLVCVDEQHSFSATGLANFANMIWRVVPATAGSIVAGQGTADIVVLFTNTVSPTNVQIIAETVVCDSILTDTILVTVNAIPDYTISAPDMACQHAPVNLTVEPTAGIASYTWNFGDGNTDNGTTPSHEWEAAGTFPITVALNLNICGNPTVFVATTIQINPVPVAYLTASNSFFVCPPNWPSTTLTVASQNFATYTWSTGNVGDTLNVIVPGIYTVTATDAVTGCSAEITRTVAGCGPDACSELLPWDFVFQQDCDVFTFTPVPSSETDFVSWNFGDGTGSFNQNPPPHTYAHPGFYQVGIQSLDERNQCYMNVVQTVTVEFVGNFMALLHESAGGAGFPQPN